MDDLTCRHGPAHAPVSRRRLLTGAVAGAGLLVAWRAGVGLAETSELGSAANANDPAHRLEIPPFVPAPSTTIPIEPPGPGEILFPLLLGSERTCYVLDNWGDTRGRCCGYYHQGVDIMADENTPQLAVADGVLTKRYADSFFGWTLTGDDGVTYKYFHNTPDDAGWSEGDRVEQGDVIGFVGDSGTSAGNYHLHFEYRPNDESADPFDKLQSVPGATFQT